MKGVMSLKNKKALTQKKQVHFFVSPTKILNSADLTSSFIIHGICIILMSVSVKSTSKYLLIQNSWIFCYTIVKCLVHFDLHLFIFLKKNGTFHTCLPFGLTPAA
ncbi:uncharacterized protein EV154DRAFT_495522 [Mucor mucedo]|uniref:uncharacterized protein n=1 Tax=Mucor mucedo TaxID=29922 RepID=UPI0022210251|nr:uncharacterized protein EV154DRAFT_495522 [Mucor mucedo]KAI7895287.1 hypothetical protein EV154DRAFT_495522 [Mucor mucedo]